MLQASSISHAHQALRAERINHLAKNLSDGVYEREHTIKMCLLAALSGESVFLLGPPGIAKSLIAKRLIQAFESSSYFEYLMTRFSTPEEVFGPLSIQELKDNGKYVRLTKGYLPTAQVVFLDEIWKAGPAILNTLLTVVNEKTFKNGNEIEKVPMRLLISASNELPDQESGLEALYDRMLVRIFVNRIQDKHNFHSMLTVGTPQEAQLPDGLAISNSEYHSWLTELEQIRIEDDIFEKLYRLKTLLEKESEERRSEIGEAELYVSDRRWKKAAKLLKASAFFNGRDHINPLDILLIRDCLWNSPESRNVVISVVEKFALNDAFNQSAIDKKLVSVAQAIESIQTSIEQELSMKLKFESASGLLGKDSYQFDLSNLKEFKLSSNKSYVRLVMLQKNLSISESEKGDSRWIYITKSDLTQVISNGGGQVYGYVNQNENLCHIRFTVDVENRLVVKDIANRSVLVDLVKPGRLASTEYESWVELAEKTVSILQEAKYQLVKVKSDFHTALPHNFIENDLPILIESRLQNLADQIEKQEAKLIQFNQRLRLLSDYYGE